MKKEGGKVTKEETAVEKETRIVVDLGDTQRCEALRGQ